MKLKERSYQTVMQMKGLSPEKQNILEDDLMRKREVNTIIAETKGEEMIAPTGSETTGYNRNLGDPLAGPRETGLRSVNSAHRGDGTDGKLGVGSVHRRGNITPKRDESQTTETLEGTDRHTKCNKETPTIRRDGQKTETKLLHITKVSQENPRYRFTSLASLLTKEYLASCFSELEKDKATGADGVSVEEYGKNRSENIEGVIARMKQMSYRPQAVRRVYIPKGNVR
jgi:hypothetical protein